MTKQISKFLEFSIGLRYTRAKKNNRVVSFISLASIIGIALGIIVLIVVLSVMNGFEQAMRDRILSMIPHLTISEEGNQLSNWQREKNNIEIFPKVDAVAPYIHKQLMLSKGDVAHGVSLYGIDPTLETGVSYVANKILNDGSFNDLKAGEHGIILGKTLAKELAVEVGDKIVALSPISSAESGQQSLPELKQFTVAGLFKVDMQQYDATYAYAHIEDIAEMFNMGKSVTGLRVKLSDPYQSGDIASFIYENSSKYYWISDWTQEYTNEFTAIKMQKTMLFMILVMIVLVAVFNLLSTLSMIVHDKQADIAILRTLGLTPRRVMGIFMVQGTIIGLLGTLIGTGFGILFAANVENIVPLIEQMTNHHFIDPKIYGISEVVASINISDVVMISSTALILSILATLYPAWKASKVQPAEALRYE